jgi:AraC-like DNA-binding protein
MLQLAICEQATGKSSLSERASLAERVRAHIEERLRDPQLTIDSLAAAMERSKSALHRAVRPASIRDLIWTERLRGSRAELLNPAMRLRSIKSVALSWGFRDSSHFCHAFRREFGHSPRQARQRAMGAARSQS